MAVRKYTTRAFRAGSPLRRDDGEGQGGGLDMERPNQVWNVLEFGTPIW